MLVALCVLCLIALAATTLSAYLLVHISSEDTTRVQRHSSFCTYLATQTAAVSTHPDLAPLLPGLQTAYVAEGCP